MGSKQVQNRQQSTAICFVIAYVLLSGCGQGQVPGPTITPAPANTPGPTSLSFPAADLAPSPVHLAITTQPQCWTVVTSNETRPENMGFFGQTETTFELEGGSLQMVGNGSRLVIEQMEVRSLSIGGKKVALTSQQVSGEHIQTEEFGGVVILARDPAGQCMVIVTTIDQFTEIINWVQKK